MSPIFRHESLALSIQLEVAVQSGFYCDFLCPKSLVSLSPSPRHGCARTHMHILARISLLCFLVIFLPRLVILYPHCLKCFWCFKQAFLEAFLFFAFLIII